MLGPTGPESPKPPLLAAVLRWLVAAALAASVTLVIFVAMTRMVDGAWILDRILRVFPLEQTALADPCEAWETEAALVPIQGVVGYYGPDGFVPLHDAEIVGEHAPSDTQTVEVSPEGVFRFVTAFADERPPACATPAVPGATGKRLRIRAPGCVPRDVPVNRSWIPHRVLLDCEARA